MCDGVKVEMHLFYERYYSFWWNFDATSDTLLAHKLLSQILSFRVSDIRTSDQYPKARGLSFDVQDRVKKLVIQNIDEGRVDQ